MKCQVLLILVRHPTRGENVRKELFLSDKSRVAYRLEPLLEQSMSSTIVEEDCGDSRESRKRVKRQADCKRGCPAVLQKLSIAYSDVGIHTGKTAQYRKSAYPHPTKGELPRNVTAQNKWIRKTKEEFLLYPRL